MDAYIAASPGEEILEKGWIVGFADGHRHVLPKNDSIEHRADACLCGPTTTSSTDDPASLVITHNAADGRD